MKYDVLKDTITIIKKYRDHICSKEAAISPKTNVNNWKQLQIG